MNLTEHVEQFARRVIQDAVTHSTAECWNRRAAAFEAAIPRPGDFTGRASAEALEAQRERLKAKAMACRNHARLIASGDLG